ncbi:MAG TPA: PilZ domain-containing protein [Terriglobia bacterium]|nr:PilZ domain-containing protein [Terriglobia bacterium]
MTVIQGKHGKPRESRVAVNFPVRLIQDPNGERRENDALLLDVSERGVRLVANAEVRMGEEVEVIPQEGPEFSVQGRVVWIAVFQARHENHVGIQLARPHEVESWKG